MAPPLGTRVRLPDGAEGLVLASWDGYWRPTPGAAFDYELVRIERVYVLVVEQSACQACPTRATTRYVTVDAEAVLELPHFA